MAIHGTNTQKKIAMTSQNFVQHRKRKFTKEKPKFVKLITNVVAQSKISWSELQRAFLHKQKAAASTAPKQNNQQNYIFRRILTNFRWP